MLNISFSEWTVQNTIIKVLVSMVLGIVIGIDRGVKRRGGGARTTMTVCLGATMVMLTEQYIQILFPGQDSTRMGAQVISGIGFLGVGTIIVSRHRIKGLTSAASTWACACIGLAVGIGFIDGAVLVTVVMLIGLHIIPAIEQVIYKHSRYFMLYIEVEDGKAITELFHKSRNDGCFIDAYEVDKPKAKGQYYTVMLTLKTPRALHTDEYLQELRDIKGVISVEDI